MQRTFLMVFTAVALMGGPSDGQQVPADAEGAVIVSPIPPVRVIRPDSAESAQDADAEASGQGADEESSPVRVVTPGQDGQVTVVFSSSQGETDTQAQTDPDVEDANIPQWQRDRGGRFLKAPEREPLPEEDEIQTPVVPIELPGTSLLTGVRLRQLDKMTGQTQTYELAVGETRQVARLQVSLEACRAASSNATHGTMAYLKIWDTKNPNEPPAFTGWMFAESPALSALDHPRYDLWVINCTTSEG